MNSDEINNIFGDIDLYLMDIILRGILPQAGRVLDAGCGAGRNLIYFLHHDFNVHAVEINPTDVRATNFISRSLGKGDVCVQADVAAMPFSSNFFDVVICSRVLHFSSDEGTVLASISELKRVLKPQGVLYLSMNSCIGLEQVMVVGPDGKYKNDEGTHHFLLTKKLLEMISKDWEKVTHHRTVIFDLEHAETTMILRKRQ